MSTTTRIGGATLAVTLLLSLPIVGSAYEVTIIEGRAAESEALNDGKYDFAIRRLEMKLEQRRNFRGVLLTNLCTALVVTRDFEKAHKVCNEAVEIKNESVGAAYNSRGVLHALMGEEIEAMADFAEAARMTNYPRSPISVGDSRYFGSRLEAENNLSKALLVAEENKKAATEYFDKMTAGRNPNAAEEK